MKNGDVQGLVVQNPVLMGYLGVMTVVKHLQGEKVEKRIDTGVVWSRRKTWSSRRSKNCSIRRLDKYLK